MGMMEARASTRSDKSVNEDWHKMRGKLRPSMFSMDVEKIGVLKKLTDVPTKRRLPPGKDPSMYFELSGHYLRYYRIQRRLGERLRKRLTFFGRRGGSLQDRIQRERPEAIVDLRLVNVELDPNSGRNHMLRIRSLMSEEFLELRAPTAKEAEIWVRVLKAAKTRATSETRRRSAAVAQGYVPQSVQKPDMPLSAGAMPAMEQEGVEVFARAESRAMRRGAIEEWGGQEGFTLLSWNILADMFVTTTRNPEIYRHCDRGCLPWEYRFRRISKVLRQSCADVICLQEVEQKAFDGDLGDLLRSRGYDGQVDCNTKKTESGTVSLPGTATFWRRDMFELAWRERSYRSLVLGLRVLHGSQKGAIVVSVNSHLEGAPWRIKDRHAQMRAALKKVKRKAGEGLVQYVVLCGDYNDGALSELCQGVLAKENNFVSAYDNSSARDVTCLLMPMDSSTVDLEKNRVDHIFFDDRLQLCAVQSVMEPEGWSREGMIEQGLPSLQWPSDHLSIGAVFRFNPDSALFKVEPEEIKGPDPFEVFSSAEILADKTLNPLTEVELDQFVELDTLHLSMGNAGKRPDPAEIERMKEMSGVRERWLSGLPDEKREFCRKVIALQRKELKAERKKNKKNKKAGKSGEDAGPGGAQKAQAARGSRRLSNRLSSAAKRLSAAAEHKRKSSEAVGPVQSPPAPGPRAMRTNSGASVSSGTAVRRSATRRATRPTQPADPALLLASLASMNGAAKQPPKAPSAPPAPPDDTESDTGSVSSVVRTDLPDDPYAPAPAFELTFRD